MTRHILRANSHAAHVHVGFDRPLNTFYAQVHFPGHDADDIPDIWLGADTRISDAHDIITAIRAYAHIPPELYDTLTADQLMAPLRTTDHNNAVTRW